MSIKEVGFNLGRAFQDVYDIYANGRALYNHSDLANGELKSLMYEECVELRIFQATMRSELFVFHNYRFEEGEGTKEIAIRAIPYEKNPSSLSSTFLWESCSRIANAIKALAITLFSSFMIATAFYSDFDGAYKEIGSGWEAGRVKSSTVCSQIKNPFPKESKSSHVTSADIMGISKFLVGYRHVSTEKEALSNATKGFRQGSSLNISFFEGESSIFLKKDKFKDLDDKVTSEEGYEELIQQYEKAITRFICSSIGTDEACDVSSYEGVLKTLEESRFMIVKTGWLFAEDTHCYGGLGRFAKENVGADQVILLPRIAKEKLNLPEDLDLKKQRSIEEMKVLRDYLASYYREALLNYIRNEFTGEGFKERLVY